MMPPKKQRRLRIETLEDRRVLSAGPITSDVQLLSVDQTTGAITAQNEMGSSLVEINSHAAARNGVLIPFLSGDFNNDDATDLLARDATDSSWWLQLNDGTELFEIPMGDGLSGVEIIGTLDINGNGLLDVVSLDTANNEVMVSINRGDSFLHDSLGSFPTTETFSEKLIGDFDGDGRDDVLLGEVGGEWHLVTAFGVRSQAWGQFPDYGWTEVLSGNFNDDQFSDVVALAPDNTWWIWQGSSVGSGFGQYFGHWKMGSDWQDISAADFTGDGIDDVIGRTPDGRLRVGTAESDGFHTWIWGTGWSDSDGWSNVSILDVDGDDLPDQIGQANDGSWWYAHNTGSSFENYAWQTSGNADFVLPNFLLSSAVDAIDSMPAGGVDTRELEVSTILTDRNLLELNPNTDIQIDGMTFTSASGALVPPVGGGATLSGASAFDVSFGRVQPRLSSGDTLPLGVGWDSTKAADLAVTVQIGGSNFLGQVPLSLGPAVENSAPGTHVANDIYFRSLPPGRFLPQLVPAAEFVDIADPFDPFGSFVSIENTISSADAKLQVSLSAFNQLMLTSTEPLSLTSVELRSASGSMQTLSGGTNAAADPFLEFAINRPDRIIFTSETWPLQLDGSLLLNAGWRPNAVAKDLIVEYRLDGDTGGARVAYVAEPLRLPFVDPDAPTNFGGQRANSAGAIRAFFGSVRQN